VLELALALALATATATPPSLAPGALATELRESNRRRLDELAELQRERVRLEQLAAEIAIARRELAREAALLEARAAQVEARGPLSGASPGTELRAAAEAGPDEAQVEPLARTLKGMKPDPAAALVARLEKPLAVAVLRKLRPADAAGVLSRMPAAAAAELFTLMARPGGAPR
jgi:flagellar motility protein MotE (MotC chaperone)